MRKFAFRASLDAAAVSNRTMLFSEFLTKPWLTQVPKEALTANWTQHVNFTGTQQHTIYRVDWPWLASGIVVSLLGIVALIPLYIGWWELGRPVSLNPLEVANAFGAPLLDTVNSNADRSHIARDVGYKQVRYGSVEEGTEGESLLRLRVEENQDERVGAPKPGGLYE